ncbi:HAD family hydrolase [Cerasicoccus fimbriatus]|uniref:HAD family hydrolase n=1 Tax=Cerasicoccus fimbriatus TaxID=3014554 RepID=UPI0022B4B456|nr:HAD family hydrolase [Cerasicoccus sp. TK19100]
MRSDVKTVFFDLDGTLIDHFTCIYRCYEYAVGKMGLPPVSYDKVRATVGGSVRITMGKLVGVDRAEEGETLFRERFEEIMLEDLHPLPGVESLLHQLHEQGVQCAVFTNKHGPSSRKIMAHLGYDAYLKKTIGTYDTPWRKPEPEFSQYALEQMDADPATSIMIGDSPFDVLAGKAGGMRTYVVATGSHSVEELEANDPPTDGVFRDMVHLAEEVFGLAVEEVAG